jgi:hypothetical protein
MSPPAKLLPIRIGDGYDRISTNRAPVTAPFLRGGLIASFYLVDRGLWHRLPGISSF